MSADFISQQLVSMPDAIIANTPEGGVLDRIRELAATWLAADLAGLADARSHPKGPL